MTGSPLVYALSSLAAGSALALSRARREHRPIDALLAGGLAADLILEIPWLPFAAGVVMGTAYPWAAWGVVRGVLRSRAREGHRGDAGEPSGVGVMPRAVRLICGGGRRRGKGRAELGTNPNQESVAHLPILLAFAAYVSSLLLSHLRGPALAWCYAAAQGGIACGMGWEVWRWRKDERRRGGGTSTPSSAPLSLWPVSYWKKEPGPKTGVSEPYASRHLSATVACALVVAAAEIANAGGPYILLPSSWIYARITYALAYVGLTLIQAGALWKYSRGATVAGRP